ncbi:MAG: hypothetical protein Q9185_003366 [Variospora sp. 1 TL-2023]
MKVASIVIVAAASNFSIVAAKHGDNHLRGLEHRHIHHKGRALSTVENPYALNGKKAAIGKRTGQCQFPEEAGLVAVAGSSNGGWAMSPDECCEPGGFCPYACPPGELSMQWDPKATSYSYPQSMHGGLFCDDDGMIKKPFPKRPYCVKGTGNVGCRNKASSNVAICQTVLPGNEAMLIPTNVETLATLAIPGPEYWAGTAAHFYVNPPGVSADEGCVWGTADKPHGNWAPYVLGGNAVEGGETFIKLGWNPIYLEPATPFRDEKPTFGIEIECDGGGCNGLPCAIDPSQHGVNELVGGGGSTGAGGAVSCVVTVPAGSSARFVVTEVGGSGKSNNDGSSKGSGSHDDNQRPSKPPPSTHFAPPPPPPSTSSSSSSTSSSEAEETPPPTPTPITSTPSSTPTPTPTPTRTPTSSSSSSSVVSSSSEETTFSAPYPTSLSTAHSKMPPFQPYKHQIFAENSTATMVVASGSAVGSASISASNSQHGGTRPTTAPPAFQPIISSSAAYTHITATAFGLTALAAVAVIAL